MITKGFSQSSAESVSAIALALLLLTAYGLLVIRPPLLPAERTEFRETQAPSEMPVTSSKPAYRIHSSGHVVRSDHTADSWVTLDELRSRATALCVVDDVLYVGTESAGLFKSSDGGANWEDITPGLAPMPNVSVTAIGADEYGPGRLVVATGYWLGTSEAHFTPSGIFLTEDGGATWRQIADGPLGATVDSLAVSASGHDIVMARLSDGTVLVLGV